MGTKAFQVGTPLCRLAGILTPGDGPEICGEEAVWVRHPGAPNKSVYLVPSAFEGITHLFGTKTEVSMRHHGERAGGGEVRNQGLTGRGPPPRRTHHSSVRRRQQEGLNPTVNQKPSRGRKRWLFGFVPASVLSSDSFAPRVFGLGREYHGF